MAKHKHDYYPFAWAERGWDDDDYPTMRRPGVKGDLAAWLKEHGRARPRGFYPPRKDDPVLWQCRTCIDTIDYVEAFRLKMLDSIQPAPAKEDRLVLDDRLYVMKHERSDWEWPKADIQYCRNCRALHTKDDFCDIAPLVRRG